MKKNPRLRISYMRKLTIYILIIFVVIVIYILHLTYQELLYDSKHYIKNSKYDSVNGNIPNEVFLGDKYVHLDLKGAPPKIEYYESLFPMLNELGATGLLIEYEDMFPYQGSLLESIPAYNTYSLNDVKKINSLAESNNLTIIPLIQTFGHLEFLLKLKEFSYLREVPKYPQVICPTNNMTLTILLEMISQVLDAHPKSTRIHIGADEVYHIGMCDNCIKIMKEQKMKRSQLFLMHVMGVTQRLREKHPHVNILMWDDEFRSMNANELQESAVNFLVEPVIWKYKTSVFNDLGHELFDAYSKVFPNIWIASAFKGATGSSEYLTSLSHHILNHQSWMHVYHEYKHKLHIQGIFITGWQRFDHFAVLCELLPVGIPSLAMSLGILLGYNTRYDSVPPKQTLDILRCTNPRGLLGFKYGPPYCSFPGAQVLDVIVRFHLIKEEYNELLEDSRLKGWARKYNIDHNFSSPNHIIGVASSVHGVISQLTYLEPYIMESMLQVYDNYTVLEWTETYFKPFFDEVQALFNGINNLLNVDNWPRRPLNFKIDDDL